MPLRARIPRDVHRPPPRKREGDSASYLKWLHTLPCVVTGKQPCDEAHHLLRVYNDDGTKRIKGIGLKQPDRWALPLADHIHDAAHDAGDDESFFASLGFDARSLCQALWALRDDNNRDQAAQALIFKTNARARLKTPDFGSRLEEIARKFGGRR